MRRLASNGNCPVHPGVVGTDVVVRSIDAKCDFECGGVIHLSRVEAWCSGWDADWGDSVRNLIIVVCPGDGATFRDSHASRLKVEGLLNTCTIQNGYTYRAGCRTAWCCGWEDVGSSKELRDSNSCETYTRADGQHNQDRSYYLNNQGFLVPR